MILNHAMLLHVWKTILKGFKHPPTFFFLWASGSSWLHIRPGFDTCLLPFALNAISYTQLYYSNDLQNV